MAHWYNAHVTRVRRAFTLIELLVSIGILVLLIAILLPALSMVREQGKTVVCLSNLRQLGIAFASYSSRNNGYIMPGYADPAVMTLNAHHGDAENYATMMVNEHLVTAARLSTLQDPVSPSYSVLHCPSGHDDFTYSEFSDASGVTMTLNDRLDERGACPWRVRSKRTGNIVDTWYGINATIEWFDPKPVPGSSPPVYITPYPQPIWTPVHRVVDDGGNQLDPSKVSTLGQIRDPSRMVLLFDGIFQDLHFDPNRINARHGRRTQSNILFIDGHAQTFTTASLPGGLYPPNAGVLDIFCSKSLGTSSPELCWRTDQY